MRGTDHPGVRGLFRMSQGVHHEHPNREHDNKQELRQGGSCSYMRDGSHGQTVPNAERRSAEAFGRLSV